MTERIGESDLLAFVDGALPPIRAAEIAQHLTTDPEAGARVAAYRRQNTILRKVFAGEAIEMTPPTQKLVRSLGRRLAVRRTLHTIRLPVATLCGAAILVAVAASVLADFKHPSYVGEAINAHRYYAKQREVLVDVTAGTEMTTWLSRHFGRALPPPLQFEALGYRLVGGRVVLNADEPATLLEYESLWGDRLTVFVAHAPDNEPHAIAYDAERGVAVAYWSDGILAYAISSATSQVTRRAADSAMPRPIYRP